MDAIALLSIRPRGHSSWPAASGRMSDGAGGPQHRRSHPPWPGENAATPDPTFSGPEPVNSDAPIRIRLLGGFGIATGSPTISPVAGKRQRTLVAYLLLHRLTHHDRKHLAFLLWPDSEERQALTNLRQLIHDVRAMLPDPDRFIEAGRQLVGWRPDAPCVVDVDEFEARAADGMRDPASNRENLASLISAVDLYTGDLLPECYDEWIEPERDRLRRTLTAALERLVHVLEARREYRAALPHAERLLDLDPLNEASLLSVMRSVCGRRGARQGTRRIPSGGGTAASRVGCASRCGAAGVPRSIAPG